MDCSLWLDTHTARECFDLLAGSAVSSGEHGVGIDQKSSAKRRAEVQKQGLSVKKHFTNRDKICTCSVGIIVLYTSHQRNATEAVGFCQIYICCIKDLLFDASDGEKSLALTFNHIEKHLSATVSNAIKHAPERYLYLVGEFTRPGLPAANHPLAQLRISASIGIERRASTLLAGS